MWKNTNKFIIFSLLIGLGALCYAQNLNLEPKESTTIAASSSISPLTDDVDKKHNKTTSAPITTTSTTTTTTSTTAAPTTTTTEKTTSTTSTTTEKPTEKTTTTTTTETPTTTTTTEKPTTTTTSTTTEKPTTTSTTVSPITTVKPTPAPKPKPGIWTCECLQLQMLAKVNFNYTTKDNKTLNANVTIPENAKVLDCECDKPEIQNIVLYWGSKIEPSTMTVQFEKKNKKYGLSMLLIKLDTSELPNAKMNESQLVYYNKTTYITPVEMSYHCTREQKLNLTSVINTNETMGSISLMDLQFEAFHSGNSTWKFSTAKDCDAIDTPDIVPIAVGIALIALIVIILISYLVARRRSLSRGYVSF